VRALVHDLCEFIGAFLGFDGIGGNQVLCIFVLQFLILTEGDALGEVDVSIEVEHLHCQLYFLVDVEVEGQFNAVVGEGSAILRLISLT
jgi:hypothetical protein